MLRGVGGKDAVEPALPAVSRVVAGPSARRTSIKLHEIVNAAVVMP